MEFSWFKNIVEKINFYSNNKKINSPSIKVVKKTKNTIEKATIYQGLSYSDAKDLVESVVEQKLINFKDAAENQYLTRTTEFGNLLKHKLKQLPENEISKLKDPDTQLALFEAAKASGRKQSVELREMLANLVINRIKNEQTEKEELKNLVYNEAITTVGKLTVDQLKIVTLCFLLRYTTNKSVTSFETLNNYLNQTILPFVEFKSTESQFEYLQYTGCTSISSFEWRYTSNLTANYFYLFLKFFSKEEVDNLKLDEGLKNKIFVYRKEENKFHIPFTQETLKEFLEKQNTEEQIIKKVTSLYTSHMMSDNEIEEVLVDKTDNGKKLFSVLKNSQIQRMNLSSVGKAIAITYFEQVTNMPLNVDIWIN